MEKVTQIPASPMDVFLLPVWIHRRISAKRTGLIPAFLFVGAFDILFFDNVFNPSLFTGSVGQLFFKLVSFTVLALLLGAIDVVCIMYPIADFALFIGRRSEKYVNKHIHIILMKSYALSHILFVLPVAFIMYSGVAWDQVGTLSLHISSTLRILVAIVIVLSQFLMYFQLGILFRTLTIRTRIQIFGKMILVMAAYFWMGIGGSAIEFLKAITYSILRSL